MARSESTRLKRLTVLSDARLEVPRELQSKVFELLVALKEKTSGETSFDKTELFPAARALAKELGVYSKQQQEGLQDSAHIIKEMGEERKNIAVNLAKHAEAMLQILNSMPRLMRKFEYQDDLATCLTAACLEERKADAELSPKTNKKRGQGHARIEIARYIAYAWKITTGKPPENLKRNAYQDPCGDFYDFICSVLALTKETKSISVETLQRQIAELVSE